MRGGAYAKGRDPGYIPRLEGLVEGMRADEGSLHSAKRMVSKSEAQRVRGSEWISGERTRGGAYG